MTLSKTLLVTIENRKQELLHQVNKIKIDVLGPLTECKDIITCKIKAADDVVKTGM